MSPRCSRILASIAVGALLANAQMLPISVQRPQAPLFLRPYESSKASPVRLNNSFRLQNLVRAGKLYLTVHDAIALAIENNLDLEVDRYGPLTAEWQLQRDLGGGPLRGVPANNSVIGQVASGQGVQGSTQSAGLSSGGGNGGGNGGNVSVTQIGPITQNLDPVVQSAVAFSHLTTPFANTTVSGTTSLVQVTHTYATTLTQGLLTGGFVQLAQRENYLQENAPGDILNPSVAPRLDLYIQHNLLSGFGVNVNSRFITVGRKNKAASLETFRSQLLDLVSSVLNAYWDLASGAENVKAKLRAHDVARKFQDDTQKEIELGVVARVDIARAQAEMAARRQDQTIAIATLRQQENQLKNLISRKGMADPLLDEVEIVTLDSIQVPETEELPPLRELLATALVKRPDVSLANTRIENGEINALGTANGIRPQLIAFGREYARGLAGDAHPFHGVAPDPYFVGGYGTGLGQIFRRNFPNQSGGFYFQIPIGNRVDQGDYGVDQLQLRQDQLSIRRDQNAILVQLSNQMVAVRQARARYTAAMNTLSLQEQLLQTEQQKFSLGIATFNDLVIAQRNLVNAQSSQVASLGAYAHAKVGLDQTLGVTLETNHVSLEEGLSGRVARESVLPAIVPPVAQRVQQPATPR